MDEWRISEKASDFLAAIRRKHNRERTRVGHIPPLWLLVDVDPDSGTGQYACAFCGSTTWRSAAWGQWNHAPGCAGLALLGRLSATDVLASRVQAQPAQEVVRQLVLPAASSLLTAGQIICPQPISISALPRICLGLFASGTWWLDRIAAETGLRWSVDAQRRLHLRQEVVL